jgi:hypothetical protein
VGFGPTISPLARERRVQFGYEGILAVGQIVYHYNLPYGVCCVIPRLLPVPVLTHLVHLRTLHYLSQGVVDKENPVLEDRR